MLTGWPVLVDDGYTKTAQKISSKTAVVEIDAAPYALICLQIEVFHIHMYTFQLLSYFVALK